MIDALLTHIKDNILTNNPNTIVKGYSGARQYQDGKIVIYDSYEGEYVGLQDTKNNYFYIRYLGDMELDAAESRTTSCQEMTGTAPLRLVAWVYNADAGKLSEVLLSDIMNVDFTTLSQINKQRFSSIQLFFSGIIYDPEEIFKQETNLEDEDVRLVKNVTLIAIDFGIKFNYKLKGNDISTCLDRDFCTGCS